MLWIDVYSLWHRLNGNFYRICRHFVRPLFLVSAVFATQIGFADPVYDYLAAQKTIRILVVGAPNYGHKMTAVTWIYRLRELGFKGDIEIVLEKGTHKKIQTLLPKLPPKTH